MERINYPTTLWIGEDALKNLETIAAKSIFIVTDPFMVSSKMIERVTDQLAGKQVTIFSEIQPDPPIEQVVAGIEEMIKVKADTIIAFGGGSAIDAAKAMKYFGEKTSELIINTFIAVPTTSGTGSEVTNFSIITMSKTNTKYPLVTDEIQPDIALLDYRLVMSVPKAITADTGMDVLTHVIEAYVSTKHNVFSDALCEKGVEMVFAYLEKTYKNGKDTVAREKMHLASTLAGMAFNQASLGLNHGIAHAAGAKFHVPHGRINTILMPEIISFNAKENEEVASRYLKLANILGADTTSSRVGVQFLIRKIHQLRSNLEMPKTLTEYGLTKEEVLGELANVASAALKDATTATNPRKPTVKEVEAILKKVL